MVESELDFSRSLFRFIWKNPLGFEKVAVTGDGMLHSRSAVALISHVHVLDPRCHVYFGDHDTEIRKYLSQICQPRNQPVQP